MVTGFKPKIKKYQEPAAVVVEDFRGRNFVQRAEEHLTGKHDQKRHAGGRGAGGDSVYDKLANGEIKNVKPLGGGISETWQGEIDGVGKVVIRPNYGGSVGNHMRDLHAEIAAHAVDQALGEAVGRDTYFGSPEVVMRKMTEFGPNNLPATITVQRMIPGKTPSKLMEGYYGSASEQTAARKASDDYRKGVREFSSYDYVINNADRHDGNMIWGDDNKMYPIDHSLALTGSGWPGIPASVATAQRDAFRTVLQTPSIRKKLEDTLASNQASLRAALGYSPEQFDPIKIFDRMDEVASLPEH